MKQSDLIEENSDLKNKINELINLIKELNEKHAKEMDDIQKNYENLFKENLENQIKQIIIQFEAEKQKYKDEIKNLEEISQKKEDELDKNKKNYQNEIVIFIFINQIEKKY